MDTSVDRATDHELDRLTLQSDGKYVLEQGGSTKARSRKLGMWQFFGGKSPSVGLDEAGYPVEMDGNEIRLLIDDDLGEWYVKGG